MVVVFVFIGGHVKSSKYPMRKRTFTQRAIFWCLAAAILVVPVNFYAKPSLPPQSSNIGVNGFFAVEKAPRGHLVQAAVVMEIPEGYHVNSNRPLSKFAIPTNLRIEAPGGIRVGPVVYPRAVVRRLKASNDEQLAVYEGRAVLRFNLTVPANYELGPAELKARLKFQSCNDEVCFPPATREVSMPITVVESNESGKRINPEIFGAGTGRRRRST
jgi:DsbC/DsbD-like thiol-disulfide interchange protein